MQAWPGDTTPPAGVSWSDPPPPGWADVFQVLLLVDRSGWEYVLHDSGANLAAFGTCTGHVVLITSQRTRLTDQEQAAVADLRARSPGRIQRPSVTGRSRVTAQLTAEVGPMAGGLDRPRGTPPFMLGGTPPPPPISRGARW